MQNSKPLGPELQVSMVPRPLLWFFEFKTAALAPKLQVSMSLRLSSVVMCIHNSAIMHQNYQSPWIPDLTCRFMHAKQRD